MQEKNRRNELFVQRLTSALRDKQLTQKVLSETSGVKQVSISEYINGKSIPSATALAALARALGVSMGYLWGEESITLNIGEDECCVLKAKLGMAVSALEGVLKELKK